MFHNNSLYIFLRPKVLVTAGEYNIDSETESQTQVISAEALIHPQYNNPEAKVCGGERGKFQLHSCLNKEVKYSTI